MYVELHHSFANTPQGEAAKDIVSACVHCGFCLATCPTYLDAQDERDSPRGRIYLIKQLLETGISSPATQTHLDRCLTCRSCETTCPSGVEYGALADIGRNLVEQQVPRPFAEKVTRWLLRSIITRPALFGILVKIGQFFQPVLPHFLQEKVPPKQTIKSTPSAQRARTMLVLEGCVQSSTTPNTNNASRRVLDRLGITLVSVKQASCCGAVNYHLSAQDDGLNDMRRNIDAWWPLIEPGSQTGAEAIVSTASGCGSMLVDYGKLLAHDPAYASKAKHVSEVCKDISEIVSTESLQPLMLNRERAQQFGKVAVHTPCSLQHALGLPEVIYQILESAGCDLAGTCEKHLCCGSAGTYSILQPDISKRLLDNKIQALTIDEPTVIATGNVGCQLQLATKSQIPVRHWIEILDELTA
jgi:glycolate oxidase iron-sulfur subunit